MNDMNDTNDMNTNDKKSITIKSEPVSPTGKKILIPGSLMAHSAIKKEIPSRLPSFKPPRDLLLTGSSSTPSSSALKDYLNSSNKTSKRKYVPNVNVFRKKGMNTMQASGSSADNEKKNKTDQTKKSTVNIKKRNSNFIQTKGVFSEGVAASKVKRFSSSHSEKVYNEPNVLEKPKLVLDKKINKTHEDTKLQSVLKDDFIDDPGNLPDLNFLPNSLPTVYNAKYKNNDPGDLDKTFQNLLVKTEKTIQNEDDKDKKPEILRIFENTETPKLLLFEFPKIMPSTADVEEKKKSMKTQSSNENESNAKIGKLSSAGEGQWGVLRIHENGKAYFVVGSTIIPISLNQHLARQELMSTKVDKNLGRGEVINLGTIDASFTCSTSFEDINKSPQKM